MESEVRDPFDGRPDNVVKLTFEISFRKRVELVSPENTLHDLSIHCLQRYHDIIQIGPIDKNDSDFVKGKGALRKWAEKRALLSVAIGFLDAEFAQAVFTADPPPPNEAPCRPEQPQC